MSLEVDGAAVAFSSKRARVPTIEFRGRYEPAGEEYEAAPGTLDHFLVERYCLYTRWYGGRIQRLDIQHPPWRIAPARAEIGACTIASMQGIALDTAAPPLVHFSRRQDTDPQGWPRDTRDRGWTWIPGPGSAPATPS